MDADYIDARIAAVKARIEAYEAAILALTEGEMTQYTLDTGQSRQVVMLHDVNRLEKTLNAAYNMLQFWENKKTGGAVIQGTPGW